MHRLIRFLVCLVPIFIAGCAAPPPAKVDVPLDFDASVKALASDLFNQVAANRGVIESMKGALFVIDPFIDSDTGEVTETSRRVQALIEDEARQKFPKFEFKTLTGDNIAQAAYLISGVMRLESYKAGARLPRIVSSVVAMKTGLVIAHSDAWVANPKLDYAPTPLYRESPMYLKDKRVEGLIATAKAAAGTAADKDYFNSLSTAALLNEGSSAYDKSDYELALGLFAKAAARPDGQVMKTYSGMYQSFFRLGRAKDAEDAFGKLAELAMQTGNISVKFLFAVDNVEFFGQAEQRQQYQIWLRQLARQFALAKSCVQILGHSSKSGGEAYNERLSLLRAQRVQKLMQAEQPAIAQTTRAVGRGFKDNIIGSGSDDDRDAIDRRVEFKLVSCSAL